MKRMSKVSILTLLGLMLKFSDLMAQDPSWSIDIIGGTPYMCSNVKASQLSPFGGLGLRYSITPLLSAQFQLNGGVFAGNKDINGSYFSYNFMQYSFRGIVNVGRLISKSMTLSRFNTYLYLGAGHIKSYNKQGLYAGNQDYVIFNDSRSLFYVYNLGLNLRYYLNENIDLIAGSELNVSQTHLLTNSTNKNQFDQYLMNYVGFSFKILQSSLKKQNPDWSGVKLPYDNYDEQLKIAQAKAAEAEAKSDVTVKEAKKMMADADTKLAKAEAYSSNTVNKIDFLNNQLDTLKRIIFTFITTEKGTGNNISQGHDNNRNSDNVPMAVTPSNNLSVKTMSTKNAAVNSNNEDIERLKAQKKEGVPEMTIIEQEIVKPVDIIKRFAVVLGSFIKHENAINAKKQLADKGYHVNVVHFNDPNVQRVIVYFDSKEEAQNRLSEIRRSENSDAWLLTINQLAYSLK